jgi:uncharacterized protein involved in exopolysaccharide biosynthesis
LSSAGKAPAREPQVDTREHDVLVSPLPLEQAEVQANLLPYLRLLWENRRFMLRAGVYSLLASMLVAMSIPVRYQSVTRLMPPDNQSGSLGMLAAMTGSAGVGGLGSVAGEVLGVKSPGALFVGIIQSQTVQDRLIEQFHLKKLYGVSKIEDARRDLAEHTDVTEDRKSGIIAINVTDHDANRAAAMAQSYVNELDRLVAEVSTSSARRERIFLEGRLKAVKGELDSSAKSFSDFASKNAAIDIPAQGRAMVEAAAKLQGQLIAAQSELEGLKQIYTDNNVRVRAADAQVRELGKKLSEIGGAGTDGGARSDNSLYPSIRKLPILGVTYADLYRQTKIEETVYGLLTQQYELAKVEEAKEIPSVKVLDAAIVPTKKSFPPRTLITVLGTLLGVLTAMMWVVGKVRWDAIEASDPRKEFAAEVFTSVRASLPKFSRNGAGAESNGHRSSSWGKKSEAKPEGEERQDGKSDAL